MYVAKKFCFFLRKTDTGILDVLKMLYEDGGIMKSHKKLDGFCIAKETKSQLMTALTLVVLPLPETMKM
jgi:hypothetical protein